MNHAIDAITLEVLRNGFAATCDEMNANLIRAAYSPNIKERRDCSCALFDADGRMIAQAESIPVHLGAMPYSVAAAIESVPDLAEGDVVVLNDPYAGGAHLPDITFVAPVCVNGRTVAYVANRAHHADVGGKSPGSLAGDSIEIYQEGLRIPPVRLWKKAEIDQDLLKLVLLNVRTPEERLGDLRAQHAACVTGIERTVALIERHGLERILEGMEALLAYSERRMREQIVRLPKAEACFEDVLDNDGVGGDKVPIRATVAVQADTIRVDFTGSSPQVRGPVNAVRAVTASAVYFAVRALTDPEIPPNAGCYRPVEVIAPEGTVVNALPPAPVVGGNLETAQRIVDVILGAFAKIAPERIIAACQGTMNNVAIGGHDPRADGRAYALYETIGGGFGGRSGIDGVDGIHSHMTNTLNTPVEALETAYPLRIERYELIPGSGGDGRHRGGLGIRRDLTAVDHTARVSLLTDRRVSAPYGVHGGKPGRQGRNVILRNGEEHELPAKGTFELQAGETLSIRTPGGGGYGDPADRNPSDAARDLAEDRI